MEDIEAKARAMGWKPEDEFQGDPANWKSAEDFVRISDNVMPVLKERLEKVLQNLDKMSSELAEVKKSNEVIKEHHKRVYKTAYEDALAKIRAGKEEAVEARDLATYKELEKEEERLIKQSVENFPEARETTKSEGVPEYYEFLERNPWYSTNLEMQAFANALQDVIVGEGVANDKDFFEEVERRVRKRYPEQFKNERKSGPGSVEGGDPPVVAKPGLKKSWTNLPDDAKRAYQEHFADFLSKDEYLKEYEWPEK